LVSKNLLSLGLGTLIAVFEFKMIITSYLLDLKRHLSLIGFLPGFFPFEYNNNSLIKVAKNQIRHNCYRTSLIMSLFNSALMCLKLYVHQYDIFLTLLGATITIASLVTILIRWNWSCSTKFVNMFNEFILFEMRLKAQGLLKARKGNTNKQIISKKFILFCHLLNKLNFIAILKEDHISQLKNVPR